MPWFMVYVTGAVAVLSVLGACCAKGLTHDRGRLLAIVGAAALWPVVVLGLIQFGAVHLYATHLRRHAAGPVRGAPLEPEPVTAPMVLVDSFVRMARHTGATHPA